MTSCQGKHGRFRGEDGQLRLPWILALASAAGLCLLAVAGCDEENCVSCLDTTPPAVPTGVFSVTTQDTIYLFWSYLEYPSDRDLDRYLVWRRVVQRDPTDPFYPDPASEDLPWGDPLAVIFVEEPLDELTYLYADGEVSVGTHYEYKVSAVDAAGNQSLRSWETVVDTPRPEGFDIELVDVDLLPGMSGFDFSVHSPVDPTSGGTTADILVNFEGGVPFVEVARPANVRLQDYGTIALDFVDWAPSDGYSSIGKAELIVGHSYIVEITEGISTLNYAKFAVYDILTSSVIIDWAYQPVSGLPELLAPGDANSARGDELIQF